MPTTRSQVSPAKSKAAPSTPKSPARPAPKSPKASPVPAGSGKSSTNGHHAAAAAPAAAASAPQKPNMKRHDPHASWLWIMLSFCCMTLVPIGVYWCWISTEFNGGAMLLPKEYTQEGLRTWLVDGVLLRIYQHAWPTFYTWKIYLIWVAFQAFLFHFAPGPIGEGVPCIDGPNEGRRLKYKFNGQFAWTVTLIIAFTLHFTGVFRLTELYEQFGPMQTVCNLYTAGIIAALYIYGLLFNKLERRTDSHIYDYFMGPMLNPRIGSFDIKYFHELRPGIMQWFFTSVGLAIKQYETYGTVSTPMILICFYHLCFVNACYKGEQCVPMSMDIIYEKFGWMLCWLDLVCVPFVFPLQAYYLYKIQPFEHAWYITILLASTHLLGYWIFDTANSQKDYFRASKKPGEHIPYGFPRLPWDKLKNPKYLDTKRGTKLLLDGWWKYARHMNYLGDLMMAWSWGLTCGVSSYFPFAYTTYLTPLLLHRERRDNIECLRKYGDDWVKYCKLVPYRLIPYVY